MLAANSLSHLKPHKAEAIYRIRVNVLGLFTVLVLSYLLPLPSLPTAFRTLLSSRARSYSYSQSNLWVLACLIETGLVTMMGYNIVEAGYAIKYPRAPLPPRPSKASKTSISSPASQPKSPRPFQALSPNSSPQPQRPFSFNPSASTSSPLSASTTSRAFKNSPSASLGPTSAPTGSANANASGPNVPTNPSSSTANAPQYAQSPVSTPSRVLRYNLPPSASTASNVSGASTSSEYLATPSPVVSAYRGKHISGEFGRAFDGSYLSRVTAPVEELSDEED